MPSGFRTPVTVREAGDFAVLRAVKQSLTIAGWRTMKIDQQELRDLWKLDEILEEAVEQQRSPWNIKSWEAKKCAKAKFLVESRDGLRKPSTTVPQCPRLSLEVEGRHDLPLTVDGGEFAGDLAEVGGTERCGREGSLNTIECVEVIHAHRERGSFGDAEDLLDAQVLHRIPGAANRVIDAIGVAQHILAASVGPSPGAEQPRRRTLAFKEPRDLTVVAGPELNSRIEVRPVGSVQGASTALRNGQRLRVVVGHNPRYLPSAQQPAGFAAVEPALTRTEGKLIEKGK